MDEIADGKYDHRVAVTATGEMGDLVRAFNHMAADLETSRSLAESSSAQLTAANQAIEERRGNWRRLSRRFPAGSDAGWIGSGDAVESRLCGLMGRREDVSLAGERIERCFRPSAGTIWRRDPARAADGCGVDGD